ncbi:MULTISPECIES: secondary thiamine-phosphate synthase enzyme YjbQ [Rhizobium]|nr:secondary thiamine-phosphate synthase enzyme YjbQ [Rhizobium wenxiniae]
MPQTMLSVSTQGQGLYEFTDQADAFVRNHHVGQGLLTVFVRHTSCSLLIQENADPDVQRDLKTFFGRLVPPSIHPDMSWVVHTTEGPDDMPAHIKAALTAVSIGIPVNGGRLMLGTWQGIYLFEHRDQPHRREIVLHLST